MIGEHTHGTHAELSPCPATNVYPLPDGLSFEEAAAFPLVFETAYRMLVTQARPAGGRVGAVWGIGGGVATAALAIAKALGAQTIVTSSSDEKLARAAELGADVTVNHETGDVVAAVKEATGGGADVVVEHVGEATWKRSLDAARPGGRIIVCGATTRPEPAGGAAPRLVEAARRSSARRWARRADFEGALRPRRGGRARR